MVGVASVFRQSVNWLDCALDCLNELDSSLLEWSGARWSGQFVLRVKGEWGVSSYLNVVTPFIAVIRE